MIVVLQYQFGELLGQVFVVSRIVDVDVDKGNLSLGHQATAVHLAVQILGLRIVRQTYGIATHFFYQVQVLVMVLLIEGRSTLGTVLMAVHAVQPVRTTVQEKAFIGVGMVVAEAYQLLTTVYFVPLMT